MGIRTGRHAGSGPGLRASSREHDDHHHHGGQAGGGGALEKAWLRGYVSLSLCVSISLQSQLGKKRVHLALVSEKAKKNPSQLWESQEVLTRVRCGLGSVALAAY